MLYGPTVLMWSIGIWIVIYLDYLYMYVWYLNGDVKQNTFA